MELQSTIIALATPAGKGGIHVIRISGPDAFAIVEKRWRGKNLNNSATHTAHYGSILDHNDNIIDDVVVTIFKTPQSFTGENTIEISCHGSLIIAQNIISQLIMAGATPAEPGEFTRRSFLNGRIDLAQAEAIADLIDATSTKAAQLAATQTRTAFSKRLADIREKLIEIASLLELEIDFAEEDVEFVDRGRLTDYCQSTIESINSLTKTYAVGNAIKHGISVAIAGVTNAGKSTLLNALVDDDKAITSDIPGTTRDTIEAHTEINGQLFRFIDTAGLRDTTDQVETIGIQRAIKEISKCEILLWLLEPTISIEMQLHELDKIKKDLSINQKIIVIANKSDIKQIENKNIDISISAKEQKCVEILKQKIFETTTDDINTDSTIIISNARHFNALLKSGEALGRALQAIKNDIPSDLIAQDIRQAIAYIGEITGQITTDTLLHTIFSRFCVGK